MGKTIQDIMNMSDEDLATSNDFDNEIPETSVEDVQEQQKEEKAEEKPEDTSASGSDEGVAQDTDEDEGDKNDGVADPLDDAGKQPDAKSDDGKDKDEPKPDAKDEAKPEDKSAKPKDGAEGKEVPAEKAVEPNYKELYENIMKPFKANGKEIKLETPEEAVKLMQMGANYVKKMQAIQPNLKVLRMLESNGMLDEDKLSLLIDMSKGNKEAFAQFAKNSGIEPMDIDIEKAIDYKPGNHKVSDAEISLQSILEDVNSTDYGQDLIVEMQHSWDDASKKEIFKEPRLIQVLAEQKKSGVYDQIATQVERQKVLGHPQISGLSFIQAYQVVGKALAEQNLLKPNTEAPAKTDKAKVEQQQGTELGRGTAPAKKALTNDAQVKAASPSAKSTKKATQTFNPLAMSDEDFLKEMNNRV